MIRGENQQKQHGKEGSDDDLSMKRRLPCGIERSMMEIWRVRGATPKLATSTGLYGEIVGVNGKGGGGQREVGVEAFVLRDTV